MKKMFASILTCIMAVITAVSFSACTVVEEFDPNKTQIIVKCFPGGNGLDWLNALIADFNAANDKYEIISRPQKMSASSVVSEVKANNATADIYIMADIQYQEGIYRDLFEDLSDVLKMKPDGESGKTIEEKMRNAELF